MGSWKYTILSPLSVTSQVVFQNSLPDKFCKINAYSIAMYSKNSNGLIFNLLLVFFLLKLLLHFYNDMYLLSQ